jgi:hypothetical protein
MFFNQFVGESANVKPSPAWASATANEELSPVVEIETVDVDPNAHCVTSAHEEPATPN